MPDGTRIALEQPAALRCGMAKAVSRWLREEVAPAAAELGAPLAAVTVVGSYDCRSRNAVAGAKVSEHARAATRSMSPP